MKHATLPADAGIGSNDRDALARAERADQIRPAGAPGPVQPPASGAIKSPMTRKGDGWRPGVGKDFPVGV